MARFRLHAQTGTHSFISATLSTSQVADSQGCIEAKIQEADNSSICCFTIQAQTNGTRAVMLTLVDRSGERTSVIVPVRVIASMTDPSILPIIRFVIAEDQHQSSPQVLQFQLQHLLQQRPTPSTEESIAAAWESICASHNINYA